MHGCCLLGGFHFVLDRNVHCLWDSSIARQDIHNTDHLELR